MPDPEYVANYARALAGRSLPPKPLTKADVLAALQAQRDILAAQGRKTVVAGLDAIAAAVASWCVIEHDYHDCSNVTCPMPGECENCGQRRADAEGGQ